MKTMASPLNRAPNNPAPNPDLAHLFRGKTAPEVLSSLRQGDPLRLQQRCARRLRERYLLMDADRLLETTLARTSLVASTYAGQELSPPVRQAPGVAGKSHGAPLRALR